MKSKNYLLPHYCQWIGLAMAVIFLAYSLLGKYVLNGLDWFGPENKTINDLIRQTLFYVGVLFIAFSKEKDEDEMIWEIRVNSIALTGYIALIAYVLTVLIGQICFAPFEDEVDWVIYCSVTGLFFHIFVWLFIYLAIFKVRLWKKRYEARKEIKEAN